MRMMGNCSRCGKYAKLKNGICRRCEKELKEEADKNENRH